MAEEKETKLDIVLKPIYTLEKAKMHGISDVSDKSVYLYKDGQVSMCPFLSSVGMDWGTKKHGLLNYPCGSFCHHFHIVPETKKIFEAGVNGAEAQAKIVQTGKIKVGLSCGSGGVSFPIANIKISEVKAEEPNPSQTHLKVAQKEEEKPQQKEENPQPKYQPQQ